MGLSPSIRTLDIQRKHLEPSHNACIEHLNAILQD
jgi:hypothetical protein